MVTACGAATEDLYHYTPAAGGEVPATFTNRMVELPMWSGRVTKTAMVKVQKINGKIVEFPYPGFFSMKKSADLVATYQLPPGPNTLHLIAYAGNGPEDWLTGNNIESDIVLNAQPGEQYNAVSCRTGQNLSIGLCVQNSHGQLVAGKVYDIHKGY